MKTKSKERKHRIIVSALAICAALPLGACSSETDESEVTILEEHPQITFSWWGKDKRNIYTIEALKIFQETLPGIDVEYQYGDWNGYEKRFEIRMRSKTEADVMQINYAWLSKYSPDGEGFYDLYELTDWIDLTTFTEEDLEFGVINGKLNAIPIAFQSSSMYYNKDLYASYGLEVPTSWEDFFVAAEKMREDGVYPLGMPRKQVFLLLIAYYEQTTGREMFSQDGTFLMSVDDMQYMLEFYKRLIDEKVLMSIDKFDTNAFISKKVAGVMGWASEAANYCNALEEQGAEIVIGDYPREEGAQSLGWYMRPSGMYAISKNTKYPAESAQLLNFLVNDKEMAKLQKNEKGVPASSAMIEALQKRGVLNTKEYEATEKMDEERDQIKIMPTIMESEEVLTSFKQESDALVYDKVDSRTCAENLYQKILELTQQ